MMKKKCDHKNPLQRDGLSQQQRLLKALDPSYAKLDDRTTKDLLEYAFRYAAQLRYFDFNNENTNDQNWQTFWEIVNTKTIEEIESSANNEPHFALFLCFLKLFAHAQEQMNGLSAKHLDFYYKEVLRLKQKPAQSDKVHLIFELAKNAQQQMILAGIPFKAGKDNMGVPMKYVAEEDTLISKAQVELLRSVYREDNKLFFAAVSNSLDGLGEEPVEENASWKAFGGDHLPLASLGFALASPVLELKEGTRLVTLNIGIFSPREINLSTDELVSAFDIYMSGEEEWLGPFNLTKQSSVKKQETETGKYALKLNYKITKEEDPIVGFNNEILSGGFNTTSPVVRLILNESAGNKVFAQLEKATLSKLHIQVDVKELRTFTVENDLGVLDISKPFMPFGPIPVRGSNFYVGSKEAFTKNIKSFSLKAKWQGLPGHFKTHYANYHNFSTVDTNNQTTKVNSNLYFKANLKILSGKEWGHSETVNLFNSSLGNPEKEIEIDFKTAGGNSAVKPPLRLSPLSSVAKPIYQQAHLRSGKRGVLMAKFEDRIRFRKNILKPQRKLVFKPFKFTLLNLSTQQKDGFIKLSLSKDFGHKVYPKILAVAMTRNADDSTTNDKVLPNEPYTPLIESLSLDYVAETEVVIMDNSSAQKDLFDNREIQYFHQTPFGHSEEHAFLKSELPFRHSPVVKLIPEYFNKGEFFIGLKNIEPNQLLNILFQLDEGTAKPERDRQVVVWSILSNNHWKTLNAEDILADHTQSVINFRYSKNDCA